MTDTLGDPETDFAARLQLLSDEIRISVRSYLGLSMTLDVDDNPLILTVMDEGVHTGAIATSARLPLSLLGPAEPASRIVFYAASAGAFVDFAADLSYALGFGLDAVVLDQDRDPPAQTAGIAGLADLTQLNQALGILIERGHTPEGARIEMGRLARQSEGSLTSTAQRLIHSTRNRPGRERT